MLAEILANPAAWPLWGVFLFAATMFPLGFMLPGCVCCAGAGNCTTCGSSSASYEAQATGYGRMCCTGSIPSSVTMRVIRLSAATITTVVRGSTDASGNYSKTTTIITCADIGGDYVLALQTFDPVLLYKDCSWRFAASNAAGNDLVLSLAPDRSYNADTLNWPQWKYYWSIISSLSRWRRFQTCSGHPDIESCNIGTTASDARIIVMPAGVEKIGPYSEQKCNPSEVVLASSMTALFDDFFFLTSSGCTYSFEMM
jgi:hypothetical protein